MNRFFVFFFALSFVLSVFSCKKATPIISPNKPDTTTHGNPIQQPVIIGPPDSNTVKTLLPGWWKPLNPYWPCFYFGEDHFELISYLGYTSSYEAVGSWWTVKTDSLFINNTASTAIILSNPTYKYFIKKVTKDSLILDIGKFYRDNSPAETSQPLSTLLTGQITVSGYKVSITYPGPLACDASGNIYFYNGGSGNTIIKVAPNGTLTNFAGFLGSGTPGSPTDNNIPATSATLNTIYAIAIDGSGNVYCADKGQVRKINASDGRINTVFNTNGADDIRDMAVDPAGNIYTTLSLNGIKKTDTKGNITLIAPGIKAGSTKSSGDGGLASASTTIPGQIICDNKGNLYFGDSGCNIRRIDVQTGIITRIAGNGAVGTTGDGGLAASCGLSGVDDLYMNTNGDIFVADYTCIRKISNTDGTINTLVGYPHDPVLYGYIGPTVHATASSVIPIALTVDGQGNIFFSNNNAGATSQITSGIYNAIVKVAAK